MEDETETPKKRGVMIRCILAGVFVVVVVLFGFGPAFLRKPLYDVVDENFYRVIRAIARVWLIGVGGGLGAGLLLGKAVHRIPWLAHGVARFLRIGRWAPFLVWYGLVVQIIGGLDGYWIWIYAGITVALTACYKFLVASASSQSPRERLRYVSRSSLFQGLLISLYLVMLAAVEVWVGRYPGEVFVGHKVFLVLAAVVLLLNWFWKETFESAAAEHGKALLSELKGENWQSLATAFAVFGACLGLWQLFEALREGRSTLYTSPARISTVFFQWMPSSDVPTDIAVSLGEMMTGIAVGALLGVILVFLMDWIGSAKKILDIIMQVTQIAPIALLPDVMLRHDVLLKLGAVRQWSAICVAIFVFYPIVRALYGLRNEMFMRRILFALEGALPYGAAAVVYGEAMNATAGLGFVMVVSSATFQLDKGMVAFAVLVLLVALLSAVLRRLAKIRLLAPARAIEPPPPTAYAG